MELELSRIQVNTILAGLPHQLLSLSCGGLQIKGESRPHRSRVGSPSPEYNKEELPSESGPEGSRKHQVQGMEWTEE